MEGDKPVRCGQPLCEPQKPEEAGRSHTSMDAEDLVIDDHAQGQEIEHVSEVMPDISIAVLPGAFGIEAIRLGYAARLMVAADQMYSVGVSKFQADKERNRFDAKHAAVDVIAWIPTFLSACAPDESRVHGALEAYQGKGS